MTDYLHLLRAVRHPRRIRSSDLIERIVTGFEPLPSPDPALLAGTGTIGGIRALVLGQQKPTAGGADAAAAVNYGMMRADGYWYVVRELSRTKTEQLPVVTFIDTPGADPSKQGVERRLAWSISACISAFLGYPGPIVSTIIGEGGSGGALALQVADARLIVSDAIYSVISPESCSAILFRDTRHIDEVMRLLRPGADDGLRAGVVDEVVDWGSDVALHDHDEAAGRLTARIVAALSTPAEHTVAERLKRRSRAVLSCGARRTSTLAEGTFGPESRTAEMALLGAAPSSAPATTGTTDEPEMTRLVNVGEGDGVLGLLQHAYFSAAVSRGETRVTTPPASAAPQVLCPRDKGGCGTVTTKDAYRAAAWACPTCGFGERLSSQNWIDLLCDAGTFRELFATLDLSDLEHGGYDTVDYQRQREAARAATGASEALRVGIAKIEGRPCALAVSEFKFFGGTLGAVCGEKIRLLCEVARNRGLPLVAVTCSGGARMQEGTLGLMQMAKTNAALLRLNDRDLPYISILADPCTGGALGSYATQANVVIAEPHALIAFAGPRVMRLAGLPIDERLLKSNRAATFGGIDEIVPRNRMRSRLARYLDMNLASSDNFDIGSLHPPKDSERNIQRGMAAIVLRLADLFEREENIPPNSPVAEMRSEFVSWLADFALVTIPVVLKEAAESADPRVRANVLEALARFPSNSSAELYRALEDEHHRVRASAAIALLGAGPDDARACDVVRRLLESDDAVERRTGLFASARRPLPAFRSAVSARLLDTDLEVRVTAAVVLCAFDDPDASCSRLMTLLDEVGHDAVAIAEKSTRYVDSSVGARVARLLANRSGDRSTGGQDR
jgi:acetyl-CoA carboxylase carboxyl transferase beta subunit